MTTQKIEERFVIEARMHQGRFGAVYAAVDTKAPVDSPMRRVALRLLPTELTKNKAALELFTRNFVRVREFTHPNVPRLFDLGNDGEAYFLTEELLDGETLRKVLSHLRPERLEQSEADEIVTTIGDVLVRAHDHGIVHGDVRAENVLVTTEHDVKLLNLLSPGGMSSSPMSLGPAEDVRALAAMAYELYTGEPATFETGRRGMRQVPKRRRGAIRRALAGASDGRELEMREFLADAGLPVVGWVPYQPRPSQPRPGRSPQAKGSLALRAAVVGAAFAVGAVMYLGGERPEPSSELAQREDALRPTAPGEAAASDRAPAVDGASAAETFAASGDLAGLAARMAPEARMGTDERASLDSAQTAASPTAEAEPDGGPSGPRANRAPADASGPAPTASGGTGAQGRASGDSSGSSDPVALTFPAPTLTAYEDRTPFAVEIRRTGDVDRRLEFRWWTRDGTARDGDDYARFAAQADAFAPGEATRTLHIPIASDNLPENDENFSIELDAGPGSDAVSTATVMIIDDDR